MSPMAPSLQRVVAAVGMVAVGAGAGLLAFVSVLHELFAFENTDPAEEPYELVTLVAAAGLVTAIVRLGALVTGSRACTRRAAVAQAVCAGALTVLFEAIGTYGRRESASRRRVPASGSSASFSRRPGTATRTGRAF